MIALYLLASHLVGDFVLQTRWQAVGKFEDRWLRARHVSTYGLAFVPVVVVASPQVGSGVLFLVGLGLLHFATDSRRFPSTLGDVIAWRFGPGPHFPFKSVDEWRRDVWQERVDMPESDVKAMPETMRWPPPNPWPALPMMLDQTFHVVQIAVLAGLFL